jgi:hypothetical protein
MDQEDLGPVARLGGVIYAPAKTFESIAARPTWMLPLALWTLFSVLVAMPMMRRMDMEGMIRRQAERSGRAIPENKMREALQRGERLRPMLLGATALWPTAASAFLAGLFWILWKLFGSEVTFAQTFGVTTHAFLPAVVSAGLLLPIILSRQRIDPLAAGSLLKSNPGFLTNAQEHPVRASLLQSIDVFSLWTLALLVVGLSTATRTPKAKTATTLVTLWVLYIGVRVGWVAFYSRAS